MPLHIILYKKQNLKRVLKKELSLSPNEMTPYIKKIQQKFDEAQMFLVKNGFHQATKGLLKDIENANGINKKNN